MDIGDEKLTMPAALEILSENEAYVVLKEGRFHQVKRMFEKIDNSVTYLKRIQIGKLSLDEDLPLGEVKELSEGDLELLWI